MRGKIVLAVCLLCILSLTACASQAKHSKVSLKGNTQEEKIENLITQMTLEQKIGQLFVVGFPGTTPDGVVLDLVQKYHVGGIIHYDRNLITPEQVRALNAGLQKGARIPLYVCVDQEGGQVARMRRYLPVAPSAAELGRGNNPAVASQWAIKTAKALQDLGINTNFAPVADIGYTCERSYGNTVQEVTPFVIAAMQGYQECKINSAVKHFPGQGRALRDSHYNTVVIDASKDELLTSDLLPFQTVVKKFDQRNYMLMVSHPFYTAFGNVPACASKELLTGLVRQEWGYQGLIITDDLVDMAGINQVYPLQEVGVKVFLAGADILLCCSADTDKAIQVYEGVLAAARQKQISEQRINASVKRILLNKYAVGIMNI